MRYTIAILLLLICSPGMAKQKRKHRGHSHHHHAVAHRSHGRHHKRVVHHTMPKILTEDDILSQQFEARKGNLMPPVERVAGKEAQATLPKYLVYNPVSGVSLPCHSGSCVRAVYDGVVTKVFSVDENENKVVIVQHGNYFTVYNSVTHPVVKTGDRIAANQELGTIAANDDGEPSLNFQIWKAGPKGAKTKLDPETWMIKSY